MRMTGLASAILASAAAMAMFGTAGAQAQTVYVEDPDGVVAPGYVVPDAPAPVTVVESPDVTDPDLMPPATETYVVVERPQVVIAPRRRVVVVPPGRRIVGTAIVERPAGYVPPRDAFAYRGTVREGGYVTTGYSAGSCMIDRNGFERCF